MSLADTRISVHHYIPQTPHVITQHSRLRSVYITTSGFTILSYCSIYAYHWHELAKSYRSLMRFIPPALPLQLFHNWYSKQPDPSVSYFLWTNSKESTYIGFVDVAHGYLSFHLGKLLKMSLADRKASGESSKSVGYAASTIRTGNQGIR